MPHSATLPFQMEWMNALVEIRTPALTAFFQFWSLAGEIEGYILVIALIYAVFNKGLGTRMAVLVLIAMTLNHILKTVIQNPRPFVAEGSWAQIWAVPGNMVTVHFLLGNALTVRRLFESADTPTHMTQPRNSSSAAPQCWRRIRNPLSYMFILCSNVSMSDSPPHLRAVAGATFGVSPFLSGRAGLAEMGARWCELSVNFESRARGCVDRALGLPLHRHCRALALLFVTFGGFGRFSSMAGGAD